MSRIKTALICALTAPVMALADDGRLAETFALCAGRFSAEMEHAWLMSDHDAEKFEYHRTLFIDLLQSVVSVDDGSDMMNLRIDAKIVHAQLLSQVAFSRDDAQSAWADSRRRAEINFCLGYLLEG